MVALVGFTEIGGGPLVSCLLKRLHEIRRLELQYRCQLETSSGGGTGVLLLLSALSWMQSVKTKNTETNSNTHTSVWGER